MSRYPQLGIKGDLAGYKSDGTYMPPGKPPTKGNIVIPAAGEYYFPLGGETYGSVCETVMHSLSAVFDANLAGTVTIEGTNMVKTITGAQQGPADITDWDSSSAWQLVDITASGVLYAVATGTGNSVTKLTLTVGGTNAGGAFWNLPDLGMLRLRAHLHATHAGNIRFSANAKLGS
jgi:hypothetical protein